MRDKHTGQLQIYSTAPQKKEKNMRLIVILFAAFLNGCSLLKPVPFDYNMSQRPINPKVLLTGNLPSLAIHQFTYEPQKTVSQYQIAALGGCLPCNKDGTVPGFLYNQPVADIIRHEAEKALSEISDKTTPALCSISAQIHTAGLETNFGNTTLDLTYILRVGSSGEYIRRFKAGYNEDVFPGIHVDRLWENATRDSIRQLLQDKSFTALVNDRCVGRG